MRKFTLNLKEREKTDVLLLALRVNFFFLLVLFLPTQLGFHFWPPTAFVRGIRVDYLSPTIHATDILIWINLILYPLPKLTKYVRLFILFALVNILFSLSPFVSFVYWFRIFELTWLCLVVYKHGKFLKHTLFSALSLAQIFTLFLSLTQMIQGHSVNGIFYFLGERNLSMSTPGVALLNLANNLGLRPYAWFSHPNSLAGFALVSLFLLSYEKNKKALTWLGIASCVVLVIISFSQAAWLVLGLVLIYLLFVKAKTWQLPWGLLVSVIVSLVSLPLSVGLLFLNNYSQSVLIRLQLLKTSGFIFSNNSLFGVGLGNYIPAVNLLHLPPNWFALNSYYYQPVHNVFVLILNETGLVGLMIIVLFGYWLFVKIKSKYLIACWMAILLTGLFDHYWLTLQQNMLIMFILAGISLNATMQRR